ncbi:hypothetical protein Tco_0964078 [Tanacetum coccineum]
MDKRRVQTERISPQKRTPTLPTSQPSTNSQVLVSKTRNADGREMGDGIPTQSSAAGGAISDSGKFPMVDEEDLISKKISPMAEEIMGLGGGGYLRDYVRVVGMDDKGSDSELLIPTLWSDESKNEKKAKRQRHRVNERQGIDDHVPDEIDGAKCEQLPNHVVKKGNRLMKKGITMAEPNEYIFVTRKNFISDDNKGRMIKKSFLEIQGTFLVKIWDNTFNGIIGENAFKHIDNFLKLVGPLKIKGLSQDRSRLSIFPISLAGATSEWFKKDYIGSVTTWENLVEKFLQKFYQLSDDNEEMEADEDDDLEDIAKIFKIEGNLFDFETPLCKAFNEFNDLLKINTDLFTFDIQGIKTYEEYELNNNMTGDLEEPWSDKEDHKWYDELPDGVLKEEALIHKAKFEESWGDATPGVMKFCAWNYRANNADNTQDSQEHKKEHHDPSICQVRRFKMMKYSFDTDDEYMAIKEHEHLTIQDPTLMHVKLIENFFALWMKDGS